MAARTRAIPVLVAGLVAGTLDGVAAIIQFLAAGRTNPLRIFRYIASGVFGEAALAGGAGMAIWGIVFHYAIATIWATVFFIAYPFVSRLSRSWVASGAGYGIFVWLCMNCIVVPLSNTPKFPMRTGQALIGVAILVVAVGLPISYLAQRARAQLPVDV